jgi:hypothetical protein
MFDTDRLLHSNIIIFPLLKLKDALNWNGTYEYIIDAVAITFGQASPPYDDPCCQPYKFTYKYLNVLFKA